MHTALSRSFMSSGFIFIGLLLPLIAGGLAVMYGFDGLYGQDAYAYFNYATVDLKNQLYPPPPFFWPPGYPLAILAVSLITGDTPFAGQIVSLVCGGLVVLGTVLITYELRDDERRIPAAALGAGLVMAVTGQLWQSSIVLMADTLSLAAMTLGMWALVRYARLLHRGSDRSGGWLALAAALVAYATITRWAYGVLAVICALYVLAIWTQWARGTASDVEKRIPAPPMTILKHGAYAAVAALFILGPVLLAVLQQGDSPTSAVFGGNFQLQFTTWNPINIFEREFQGEDGLLRYPQRNGHYYLALLANTPYLTLLLALFVVPGLVTVIRTRVLWRFAPLLGWILAAWAMLAALPQQNVRFGLTFLPPVAVLIGVGAAALLPGGRQVENRSRTAPKTGFHRLRAQGLQWGAAGVFVVGLVLAAVNAADYTRDFITRHEDNKEVVRWAADHIPPDAQVLVFGLTLTMAHYTSLETHELYYLSPEQTRSLAAEQPTYVLVDVYNLETQWRGEAPHMNVAALELTVIGRRGPFTLFKANNT
ncbi:MAG: hypothetical protein OHK0046_19330 [Anaerolineae bacterium]